MIVIVFDPLAVLLLIAANWQMRRDKELNKPSWDSFFNKDPADLPEKDVVKEETELPEIKIEEHPVEAEPELYDRVKKRIDYDSAGRRITPETEEEIFERNNPSKAQSFLSKVSDVFQPKTIEKEVDALQNPNKK